MRPQHRCKLERVLAHCHVARQHSHVVVLILAAEGVYVDDAVRSKGGRETGRAGPLWHGLGRVRDVVGSRG